MFIKPEREIFKILNNLCPHRRTFLENNLTEEVLNKLKSSKRWEPLDRINFPCRKWKTNNMCKDSDSYNKVRVLTNIIKRYYENESVLYKESLILGNNMLDFNPDFLSLEIKGKTFKLSYSLINGELITRDYITFDLIDTENNKFIPDSDNFLNLGIENFKNFILSDFFEKCLGEKYLKVVEPKSYFYFHGEIKIMKPHQICSLNEILCKYPYIEYGAVMTHYLFTQIIFCENQLIVMKHLLPFFDLMKERMSLLNNNPIYEGLFSISTIKCLRKNPDEENILFRNFPKSAKK